MPAGNFAVNIGNGADGNTLADTCYAFMPVGSNKSFITTQAPAPKFDSVQVDKCNTAFVKIFFSHPIKCSLISADGSNFAITGPAAVVINGAVTDARNLFFRLYKLGVTAINTAYNYIWYLRST
ncbi:MAG: hypothetical protein WDM90_13025 [Ferruginibacter sp.]